MLKELTDVEYFTKLILHFLFFLTCIFLLYVYKTLCGHTTKLHY